MPTKKTNILKICKRCNQEKDSSRFALYNGSPDGRRICCRDCVKAEAEENRIKYSSKDTKTCTKCGCIKNITEFGISRINSCGLQSQCKECHRKRGRTTYKNRYIPKPRPAPEIFPEGYSRCTTCKKLLEVHHFGKDKDRPSGITWGCKECRRIKRKQKHQEIRQDPELFEITRKKRHRKTYIETWATNTMYRHNTDGYACEFTKEQLIEKAKNTPNCEYCGVKLSWAYKNKQNGLFNVSPSLENLDCLEYIPFKKMHITCLICNLAKGGRNLVQFLEWMKTCIKNLEELHKDELTQQVP